MRIAIETATSLGSVAVGRDDRVLAEVVLGVQTRHAERALPALETALELAGVDRGAVDEVVVGGGPGSFTGVRVAGATAKGLATALQAPLLAYSSLLALAAAVPIGRPVCGLFDARRGEVYAGCWSVSPETLVEHLAPVVGPIGSIVERLRDLEATAGAAPLFVGEGAERYRAALEGAGSAVAVGPAAPRASTLLWLARHHRGAGHVEAVAGWEPTYVRASSAERGVKG
jgi:tRNA threonylcarbamoyladenosine biosynthesis protein TsaB